MAPETTVESPGGASLRAAAALAPRAVPDGGVTLSPAAVAALAELFRAVGRGRDADDVADRADRAARRMLAALDTTPATPAPRTPGDQAPQVLAAR
ncbi:hypothetical protein EV188_102103 [Actinomycetospora succinea]|uniref:Uncharacterized protein n=1 Tax=Actinomycetospora succinea TaxID=663603 RepID=A0A4R6VKS4_9PSEU|nr:hypothetical protein [Actinomycetospora succinea]TDQ62449.1 hypothetical protein EV188_102103 [Actinomycetospora succinea]